MLNQVQHDGVVALLWTSYFCFRSSLTPHKNRNSSPLRSSEWLVRGMLLRSGITAEAITFFILSWK